MPVPMQTKEHLGSLLKHLWRHVSVRRRVQFVLVLGMTIVASFAEALTIGAVFPFLMALTSPQSVLDHPLAQPFLLGTTDSSHLLPILTLAFIAATTMAGLLRVALLWANNQLSTRIGSDLSFNIYRSTLYQTYTVHVSRNSSEVISGIMFKANAVVSHIFNQLLTLISACVMCFFILCSLLFINHWVALSALAGFSLIYGTIIKLTRQKLKTNSENTAQEIGRVMKIVQEGLGGIRDVLIDGSQKTFCQIYRIADLRLRFAQANTIFISQSPRYLVEALGMALIAAIAYYLTQQTKTPVNTLPLLGALALGAQRMLPAIQQAYASLTSIVGNKAHLKDAIELLDQPLPEYADMPRATPIRFEHEIRLNKLDFRYTSDTPWVLNNLDLSIDKGKRIGFIGETGSGKSTLVDIVMGLLSPTSGSLEIDGVPITVTNQRSWQVLIAHVPQMIYLTDSSVAENIAFGLPPDQIDMGRVRSAAGQAQIATVIEGWPKGYETVVGERGIRLSGGQRQRIGIARALYKQAKVIIFDEATSALDSQTEEAVISAIENLGRDLTILVIAHRLSTLRICDEIIELGKQGILRRGSYADIVGRSI